uniref:Uncharacterized protein n=1 Tax=Rhizophora mucronata TaxID=61149 RepID=A0A2P2N755_RHIMU
MLVTAEQFCAGKEQLSICLMITGLLICQSASGLKN